MNTATAEAPATPATEKPELTNAQIVAKRYRAMAKWLEQHPDVPLYGWETVSIQVFANSAKDADETEKQFMARAAKAMGKGKKNYGSTYFDLIADTPEGTKLEISAKREETCVRKQVGTKTVVKPARPAVEAVPETTEEVPVYEWDCGGILEPDAKGRS